MHIRKTVDGTANVRSSPNEVDEHIRLTVLASDPNFLLVYVPDGMTAVLPPVVAPFTLAAVREGMRACSMPVRATEDVVGRHLRDIVRLRKNEARSERVNQSLTQQAVSAMLGRKSPSMVTRERSEVIQKKLAAEEELRRAKAYLSEVKADAATKGKFLPRSEFNLAEETVNDLKKVVMALSVRLGELKKIQKEENVANSAKDGMGDERLFKKAAQQVLDKETYLRIWDVAHELGAADEDENEDEADFVDEDEADFVDEDGDVR
jgi:hypothetical protein